MGKTIFYGPIDSKDHPLYSEGWQITIGGLLGRRKPAPEAQQVKKPDQPEAEAEQTTQSPDQQTEKP